MKLKPPVYSDGLKKRTQVKFRGYNALGKEGELCFTENLTSDYYPMIAARPPRKHVRTVDEPHGLGAGSEIAWVDGTDLHVGDEVAEGFLEDDGAMRTFAQLGDILTVWPDGKYYDTVSGEYGELGASMTADGTEYGQEAWFLSAEEGISSDGNVLIFGLQDLSSKFRVGDAVTISGCERHPANNKTVIIRAFAGNAIVCLDDTFELEETLTMTVDADGLSAGYYDIREEDALGFFYSVELPAMAEGDTLVIPVDPAYAESDFPMTVTGTVTAGGVSSTVTLVPGISGWDQTLTFTAAWQGYNETGATVTVERAIPALEHVFAHDNRLIGLHGDTIYISKLGDPFNWNVYDGVASDSWTTDTGTEGPFTGGISYGGYPRFFKEDQIFTLYGDYPGEYELASYRQPGVLRDSAGSLAIGGGRLFYLSSQGPCVYAGREPVSIAEALGVDRYHAGVGAADDGKYFLSVKDENDEPHLFVYDIRKGLWLREDDAEALAMCRHDGAVWCLDTDGSMDLLGRPTRWPSDAADEGAVAWVAEFGDITLSSPDKKRITKLQLRMDMDESSSVTVKAQYDGETYWRTVSELTARKKRSVALPVIPRRADRLRLRIEGEGGCRISSLSIEAAANSDR